MRRWRLKEGQWERRDGIELQLGTLPRLDADDQEQPVWKVFCPTVHWDFRPEGHMQSTIWQSFRLPGSLSAREAMDVVDAELPLPDWMSQMPEALKESVGA
jgi:hypothetical protein